MLQPKKTKFRKQRKGKLRGFATSGTRVSFGEFGLKALTRGRITARQIEAARRAMTRHIKRGGKVWIRIFPDVPITKRQIQWIFVKVIAGIFPIAGFTEKDPQIHKVLSRNLFRGQYPAVQDHVYPFDPH